MTPASSTLNASITPRSNRDHAPFFSDSCGYFADTCPRLAPTAPSLYDTPVRYSSAELSNSTLQFYHKIFYLSTLNFFNIKIIKPLDFFAQFGILITEVFFGGSVMKILIGSDVVPTRENEQIFAAADVKTLFGDVVNLAKSADRIIVNLECALTNSDGAINKFGPNLKAIPESVNALKALGVTDVALANNHVFDFGIKGLTDTVEALDGAGLPYMGIGDNDTASRAVYTLNCDGKTLGIVNVCEHEYTYALPNRMGANPYDPYLTMQDIRLAKSLCDFVIVLYHGGKEYCRYPSPRLYNLCHEMVHNGADVVITQHSHCVGCYEQYEGAHIVYGATWRQNACHPSRQEPSSSSAFLFINPLMISRAAPPLARSHPY